jgi:hypothetical protein
MRMAYRLFLLRCAIPHETGSGGESMTGSEYGPQIKVTRVQTGVRIEQRMLKVLKALAEYFDISLGELLEGIVLHAFEGKSPFEQETLERIEALKQVYQMDYDATASHRFIEETD